MARPCTVCRHPRREEIDGALVSGEPLRNIVERCSVSLGALSRHKAHLPARLAQGRRAQETARADRLLDQIRHLQERALAILKRAEEAGDYRVALQAMREARGNLELLARLLGELRSGEARAQVQVTNVTATVDKELLERLVAALELSDE